MDRVDNVQLRAQRVLSWKHTSKCVSVLHTHIFMRRGFIMRSAGIEPPFWVFSEVVGIAPAPVIVI